MDYYQIVPSSIAAAISLISIIALMKLSGKIKSCNCGTIVNWVTAGIFFAVFIHAVVELLGVFGVIKDEILSVAMAGLLSIGSICFIVAATTGGLKSFTG
jgi:hypothetical protein